MSMLFRILVLIIATGVVMTSGCTEYGLGRGSGGVKVIPPALTFMISSQTSSNFTPCGCHTGKWGGMPRRGSIFESVRAESEWPVLFIDTGDVTQGNIANEIFRKKDMYIWQSYEVIGYDVVSVGFRELNLGQEFMGIVEQYDIPFVCSNVYAVGVMPPLPVPERYVEQGEPGRAVVPLGGAEAQGGQATPVPVPSGGNTDAGEEESGAADAEPAPLFDPYIIVEPEGTTGYKVGFIGAIINDPQRLAIITDYSFQPYEEAIREQISILKTVEKVDLIVVVSDADNLAMVDNTIFNGADIVIGGNTRIANSPNETLNPLNPAYVAPLTENPGLVESESAEGAGGTDEETGVELTPLPTPIIISQASGRGRLVTKFDITLDSAGRIVDYAFKEIEVSDAWADDPRMAEIARGYDTEVLSAELNTRIEHNIAGSQACEECHPGFLAAWSDSGHFQSYETIVEENKLDDSSCTRCHAMGYFEEPRLLTYDLIPDEMKWVGCEGCHPNGERHVANQRHLLTLTIDQRTSSTLQDTMAQDITVASCIGCHDNTWSPNFDFEARIAEAATRCRSVGGS